MQSKYSPELQELLEHVEAALIRAGQNARFLAERTGTKLITSEPGSVVQRPQEAAGPLISGPTRLDHTCAE